MASEAMASEMRTFRYHHVDVFTDQPLEGNPLAVVMDADDLDTTTMQRVAGEFNLSETTFVLRPERSGSAACVRIFTPRVELAFAGHPTVGTAFVLLAEGHLPDRTSFVLDEGVGPVPIRIEGDDDPLIWLETPPIAAGRVFDAATWARALRISPDAVLPAIPPQIYTAGNPNVFVALRDAHAVDAIDLDEGEMRRALHGEEKPTSVFAFTPTPFGAYSRMFAPLLGVREDPATGSATGPLAAFMLDHDLLSSPHRSRFYSEQGTKMGRRSILHVNIDDTVGRRRIEVGGKVVSFGSGTIRLPVSAPKKPRRS
jgi:trans-2,3-dihydro-3-hydroxyanthranilate isomerase